MGTTYRFIADPCEPSNGEWSYYLEGSVKNYDPPVFALPSGFRALKAGQYFVAEDDTATRLDELCSSLRLRGIHCEKGEA